MRKIYLLALLIAFNIIEITAQNIDYSTPLYTNETFSKVIDTSLPVGSIQASGDVSSGGATYTIPISLPPGTNGLAPSISFEYNSMGSNGALGAGWSISGLSTISRSGQSIYHDGKVTAVDLSVNDRFSLDGERLIGIAGTYGNNAATYGAENENFAVVTSNGVTGSGPTWFKVVNKDGSEMEYGNTADSRVLDGPGTNVLYWRLNKIKSADGNYMTFKYVFDDRDSRIDEIDYTGNDAAELSPYNKVKFSYKVRSDVTTQYIFGSSLTSKYLLDKVVITAESQNVKSYEFKYGRDNVNSYLRSVTEIGSDGSKLNPTIFKYGDKPVLNIVSSGSIQATNNITSFSGDYDGDGMPDILSIKGSEGVVNSFSTWKRDQSTGTYTLMATQSVPQTSTFRIQNKEIPGVKQQFSSDINGDGLTDVSLFAIQSVTNNSGNYLYSRIDNILHYISNPGGSSFTPQTQLMPVVGGVAYNILPASGSFVFQGDFDGDGLTEQVFQLKNTLTNSDLKLFYYDNAGGSSYSYTEVMQFTPINGSIRQDWWQAKEHQIIDFNGDGKQDIAIFWDDWVEIFTFDSATHVRSLYNSPTFPISTPSNVVHFGDFNGDGKMDVLTIEDAMTSVVKGISTGKSFIQSPFPIADHWSVKYTTKNIRSYFVLGDFNGDGKSDTYFSWKRFGNTSGDGSYFPYTKGTDIYYSTGDGFYNEQVEFEYDIEPVAGHRPPPGSTYDVPVDLNGDGRSDIVTGNTNVISRIDFFNTAGTDNLLSKVSNGLNHVIEWNYKSLAANAALYTKGGTSAYPLNIIQPAALMVTDLKVENGIGGTSVVQYNYEGLRLHRAGKGFLGFAKLTATNLATGMKTISENEFNITYFTAAPKKNATYLTAGNVLLTESTNVNEFIAQNPAGSKRFLYRLKSSTENDAFEGRNSSLTNDTFDSYGNVTQSTISNNVETTVTNTLYEAYPGSIPNKPTSVTVTKTRSGQPAFSLNTMLGYNGMGQLTSKTDFNGLPKKVVTGYEYFPLGNLKRTTITSYGPNAPVVRTTSAVYDPKGRYPEFSTNELGQTAGLTYDLKWGKPLTTTDVDGLTTTYQYDAFGRTKTTTPPAAAAYNITQIYGWDQANGAAWYSLVSHPGKPDVKSWYDKLGRQIRTETEGFSGQWAIQTQSYDARGNIAVSSKPYKSGETVITTSTLYDTYNRPYSIDGGVLGTTTIGYGYAAGNLTVTTSAPAGTSSQTTDASGQVISAADNGGTLSYTYYSHGGLKDVKNVSTTLTSNEYDEYGRQTKLIDANAGTTEYVYDALGQLVSQTNGYGQTHTMLYDILGRNTTRTGPEGSTGYEFYPSGTGASTNQIKKVTGFAGMLTEYTYDALGRVQNLTETIDGEAHTNTYGYNNYGDVTSTSYPSGFGTIHAYDANGYATTIKDNTTTITLYNTGSINGQGQVTSYTLGNEQSSSIIYTNGFPTRFLTAGKQDLNLGWNYQTSNLDSRNDAIKSNTESFIYDNLNRLKTTTIGSVTLTVNYAANGNISSKPDAGTYSYHPTKFNATTGITNPSPSPIPLLQQDITYTAFMQPNTISENGNVLTYTYGAGYERVKGVKTGPVNGTRYYFGEYEKDIAGSSTKYIQYVSSPVGLIAIVVSEGGTHTPHYTYTDHLGSILTVTNSAGTVEAEQSFDAWGRRCDPATWALKAPTATTTLPDWLYRGYTAHEHLDNFGLINMNGRMYDPVVGRMLSPDNYIQEPGMTQSYNRYSYAMNNPMVNNDPDGQFWNFVIGGIIGGFSGYKIGKASGAHGWGLLGFTLGGAAIGTFTAGLGEAAIASFGVAGTGITSASIGAYAAAGAITGVVSGASFAALAGGGAGDLGKAALWGGAIGGTTGALGGYLKHAQFKNSIYNSDRYLANCPKCAAMFPKETGNWLDEVTVTRGPRLVYPEPRVIYATPGPIMDLVAGVGAASGLIKGATHLHHSFPKFLGGLKDQNVTKIAITAHKELHKEMNVFLKEYGMAPSRSNPGRLIRENYSPLQIQKALTDFYKGPGSKYAKAAEDFFNQIGF